MASGQRPSCAWPSGVGSVHLQRTQDIPSKEEAEYTAVLCCMFWHSPLPASWWAWAVGSKAWLSTACSPSHASVHLCRPQRALARHGSQSDEGMGYGSGWHLSCRRAGRGYRSGSLSRMSWSQDNVPDGVIYVGCQDFSHVGRFAGDGRYDAGVWLPLPLTRCAKRICW